MDLKLELIVVPVSDVDRAKDFYLSLGFVLDVDVTMGEDFRVVQFTPPGSACSFSLMRNDAAGSLSGMHLVVADIEAARAELVDRGGPISDFFHFGPEGQTPGLDPGRNDFGSYCSFQDPDGNEWLLQEIPSRR